MIKFQVQTVIWRYPHWERQRQNRHMTGPAWLGLIYYQFGGVVTTKYVVFVLYELCIIDVEKGSVVTWSANWIRTLWIVIEPEDRIDMGKDFKLKKIETRGKGKNWSTVRRLFAVVNKRGLIFRFELNPILTKISGQ